MKWEMGNEMLSGMENELLGEILSEMEDVDEDERRVKGEG